MTRLVRARAARVRHAIEEANATIYEHTRGPIFICADCALTWREDDYASAADLQRLLNAHEEALSHSVHFKGPGSFETQLFELERQILAVPGLGRYSTGPRDWREAIEGPPETSGYAISNLISAAKVRGYMPDIEPRDPPHYFAGHPIEVIILGTMLCLLSLFTILWILAQRHS